MKKMQVWVSLAVAAMLVFSLAGCGGSGPSQQNTTQPDAQQSTVSESTQATQQTTEPVTINVRAAWAESNQPNWAEQVKVFEQNNPGIKVNLEWNPAGVDAMAKLRAEFISGNPPDIVQAWKTFFNEFVDQDLIEEISDVYDQNGWNSAMYNGSRSWCAPINDARSTDAKVYGVPDSLFTSVFFYNTKVFNDLGLKEPTTLDELISVSKQLKAKGIKPVAYPGKTGNIVDLFAKVQVQFAGLQPILDINAGKAKFTDEPMMNTTKAIERMVKEGVLDPAFITYDEDMCVQALVKGEAAMFSMHTAQDTALQDAKKANPDFDYSIIKGIKFTDNPKVEVSATFGGCWMIPKTSKHIPEAKKVLSFLFGEEVAKNTATNLGKITNLRDANSGITTPSIKVVVDNQLAKCSPESFYVVDMVPGKVLDNLKFGLQAMIQGKADAKKVMEEAQNVMDEVLSEAKQ